MFLNGQLVEQDLVESLVEGVKELELVESSLSETLNDLNLKFWLVLSGVWIRLVEWQDLLFLSLKLSTELSSLEDLLSKLVILLKFVHSILRVHRKVSKSLVLLLSGLEHLPLEVMVMPDNPVLFLSEVSVSVFTLFLVLLKLDSPHCDLLLDSEDTLLLLSDFL